MKRFLFFMMCCLLLGNMARGADKSISFTAKSTGLSGSGTYLTTAETFTKDGVTFSINQFNPDNGQLKVKSTGDGGFTWSNTTAMPGAIKAVKITTKVSTVGTMYMKLGSEIITGTVTAAGGVKGSTEKSGTEYVTTFEAPAGSDSKFFKIQLTSKGSGTVYASNFEIIYSEGESVVTYKDYRPVLSIDEVYPGGEYIIANSDGTKGMKSTASGSCLGIAEVSAADRMIHLASNLGVASMIYTEISGKYYLKLGETYLRIKSGTTLEFGTSTTNAEINITDINNAGSTLMYVGSSTTAMGFNQTAGWSLDGNGIFLYRLYGEDVATRTPTITAEEVEFHGTTTVTISGLGDIYYTIDGSDPQVGTSTKYTAPFTVTDGCTIRAIAQEPGFGVSQIAGITVTNLDNLTGFGLVTSVEDLKVGGVLIGCVDQKVAVSTTSTSGSNALPEVAVTIEGGIMSENANIMTFTLEGDATNGYLFKANNYSGGSGYYISFAEKSTGMVESTSSTRTCNISIDASGNATLRPKVSSTRQICYREGYKFKNYASSNLGSSGYHEIQLYKKLGEIKETTPAPEITAEATNFHGSTTITIIGEGNIYYTIDGTTPTESSTKYTDPFTVDNSCTVKAIAIAEGKEASIISELAVTKVVAEAPIVTFNGQTAENDGMYEVAAGIGSAADVVTEETSPYTFTVNEDCIYTFSSKYGNEVSNEITVAFSIIKVMPSQPVVTFNGITAENEGMYSVAPGTQLNVASANASKIKMVDVNDKVYYLSNPATVTVTEGQMFEFTGINENGNSAPFSVMFTPDGAIYTRITSESELVAGNKYVIGCEHSQSALNTDKGWGGAGYSEMEEHYNYRGAVDVKIAAGKMYINDENVMVFTLGGSTGAWTLMADNFTPGNNQGNYLSLSATDADEAYMSSTPVEYTIGFSSQKNLELSNVNNATRLLKYHEGNNRYGNYKSTSGSTYVVQLYGVAALPAKPSEVTVTWMQDGKMQTAENLGEYVIPEDITLTVTGRNANTILVIGENSETKESIYTEYPVDKNGSCTFTVPSDFIYEIYGVNEAGLSDVFMVGYDVYFAANSVPEFVAKATAHPTEDIRYIEWANVMGHYGDGQHVYIEDQLGNPIYATANVTALEYELQRGHKIRNFIVRFGTPKSGHNIAVIDGLSTKPDNVENLGEHNIFDILKVEGNNVVGESHVYKCILLQGDVEFRENEGSISYNGNTLTLKNLFTKNTIGVSSAVARLAANEESWNVGETWPTGHKTNYYVAGFIMPEENGYSMYVAQMANNGDVITGVAATELDGNVIVTDNGEIYAPEGSSVYSIQGVHYRFGTRLPAGVYVVVLKDGQAVKVFVK